MSFSPGRDLLDNLCSTPRTFVLGQRVDRVRNQPGDVTRKSIGCLSVRQFASLGNQGLIEFLDGASHTQGQQRFVEPWTQL